MKKRISGIILLVLAAAAAIGSMTFLSPCVHPDGSEAVCAGAGKALLADGVLLAVLAVLLLTVRRPAARTVLFALAALAALAGTLLPGTLLPLCRMETMRCRMVTQPAMILLFGAALLVSAGGLAAQIVRKRKCRP